MSEAVTTSNIKEEVVALAQMNKIDDYYGDKMSRMSRLVDALQKQAAKARDLVDKGEVNPNIDVTNMDKE